MNRQQLYKRHREITSVALQIMQAKNVDYAHSSDPFRNFRAFGELGILVRLSDKLSRLRSVTENGRCAVATESVYDTVLDIVNYAVLFQTYLEDQNEPKSLQESLAFGPDVGSSGGLGSGHSSVPAADGDSTSLSDIVSTVPTIRTGFMVRPGASWTTDGERQAIQSYGNDCSKSVLASGRTPEPMPSQQVRPSRSHR